MYIYFKIGQTPYLHRQLLRFSFHWLFLNLSPSQWGARSLVLAPKKAATDWRPWAIESNSTCWGTGRHSLSTISVSSVPISAFVKHWVELASNLCAQDEEEIRGRLSQAKDFYSSGTKKQTASTKSVSGALSTKYWQREWSGSDSQEATLGSSIHVAHFTCGCHTVLSRLVNCRLFPIEMLRHQAVFCSIPQRC